LIFNVWFCINKSNLQVKDGKEMDFRCYLTAFTRQRDFLYKLLPQADSGWLEIYAPNRL